MENRKDSFLDSFLELAETVVIAVFAFVCLFTFFVGDYVVVGESMENTLFNGDRLISLKFMYTPKRGDIVIVNSDKMNEVIVKRIIGEPNDIVEIDYVSDEVFLNGEKLEESYLHEKMSERNGFSGIYKDKAQGRYVYKVPFGKYLILGDNRNHSTDSRVFGFITRDEIIGKAVFRYYSKQGSFGAL